MDEQKTLQQREFKETLGHFKKNSQVRVFVFGGFLLLELVLILMKVPVPGAALIVATFLFLSNFIHILVLSKIKLAFNRLNETYLFFQIVEVIAILIAIHYFGGMAYGGMVLLMIYVLFAYFVFPQRIYPRILAGVCLFGYAIVGVLEYLGILGFHDVANVGINVMRNKFVFSTSMGFMLGALIVLAIYGDIFSKRLRNTIQELAQREAELAEASTVLEIKVQAKTRQLRELAEGLEKKVQQRTETLQKRVQELERFHRLTVGRELKMIELKKKIQTLQDEKKVK